MNGLVKIQEKDGQQLVSARDLYAFLGLSERFSSWAERNVKYGFVEGRDFTGVGVFTPVNNGAKIELQDYALTLDTAKQIAMMSRSDKGLQIREYFIECEKKLKEVQVLTIPTTLKGALQFALQQLEEKEAAEAAQRQAEQLQLAAESETAKQLEVVRELAPKALYCDLVLNAKNCYLVTTVAKGLGMSAVTLNKRLLIEKVMREVRKVYVLNSPFDRQGLVEYETKPFENKATGYLGNSTQMVWTEKGVKWLHERYNPKLNNVLKPIDE